MSAIKTFFFEGKNRLLKNVPQTLKVEGWVTFKFEMEIICRESRNTFRIKLTIF